MKILFRIILDVAVGGIQKVFIKHLGIRVAVVEQKKCILLILDVIVGAILRVFIKHLDFRVVVVEQKKCILQSLDVGVEEILNNFIKHLVTHVNVICNQIKSKLKLVFKKQNQIKMEQTCNIWMLISLGQVLFIIFVVLECLCLMYYSIRIRGLPFVAFFAFLVYPTLSMFYLTKSEIENGSNN
jgi:hypothetical protein